MDGIPTILSHPTLHIVPLCSKDTLDILPCLIELEVGVSLHECHYPRWESIPWLVLCGRIVRVPRGERRFLNFEMNCGYLQQPSLRPGEDERYTHTLIHHECSLILLGFSCKTNAIAGCTNLTMELRRKKPRHLVLPLKTISIAS